MRQIITTFRVPIFNETMTCAIAPSLRKLVDTCFPGCSMPTKQTKGICFRDECNNVVVAFRSDSLTRDVVAHEVFHATVELLDKKNVDLMAVSQETGAYVHGYLFEEYSKIVDEYKREEGTQHESDQPIKPDQSA